MGTKDVPPGYERPSVMAGRGCSPMSPRFRLIPLKLFFIEWIEKTFQSSLAAGIGFLITAAVLLLVTSEAAWTGRQEGARRDDLARRAADRHRPDVRPPARRQPQRLDHRHGAGAGVLADLGCRFQPPDRGPRDLSAQPCPN